MTRTKSCSPSVAYLLSSHGLKKISCTAAQCRAARALLKWSQDKLAEASKVSAKTVGDFEREARTPHHHILADIGAALESAGVEFTNGDQPGVRLRKGERRVAETPPREGVGRDAAGSSAAHPFRGSV